MGDVVFAGVCGSDSVYDFDEKRLVTQGVCRTVVSATRMLKPVDREARIRSTIAVLERGGVGGRLQAIQALSSDGCPQGGPTWCFHTVLTSPEILSAFVRAAADRDIAVRKLALAHLNALARELVSRDGTVPDSVLAAVPHAVVAFESVDAEERQGAVNFLMTTGRYSEEVLAAMVRLLDAENRGGGSFYFRPIANILGEIGPTAKPAVAGLLVALKHEQKWDLKLDRAKFPWPNGPPGPRVEICRALGRIQATSAISALRAELRLGSRGAAWALGALGPKAKVAIPDLVAATSHTLPNGPSTARLWVEAVLSLGKMGPSATQTIPTLLSLLSQQPDRRIAGQHADIREAAAIALGQIGDAPGVVPALGRALWDVSGNVQRAAANSLGKLGDRTNGAIGFLVQVVRDHDRYHTRLAAATALGQIGVDTRDVRDALKQARRDDSDGKLHEAAIESLEQIRAGKP